MYNNPISKKKQKGLVPELQYIDLAITKKFKTVGDVLNYINNTHQKWNIPMAVEFKGATIIGGIMAD